MVFPSNPKSRILDSLRKPSGFKPGTPSKTINRNPINRPNPNPGVGDYKFPGNLSPSQPNPGGGYTFPGNLSPQQPTNLPPIGKESNFEFPKPSNGKLPPFGKESKFPIPKPSNGKLPPIPDKPTRPGGGMIKLDPREWEGGFDQPQEGGNYFPGFPSQPQEPGYQLDPREWTGGFDGMQPPERVPYQPQPGQPPKPGTPGISPDPVKKNGRSLQGDDTTRKFVMDAFDKGFDAKTILNFLSNRFKK